MLLFSSNKHPRSVLEFQYLILIPVDAYSDNRTVLENKDMVSRNPVEIRTCVFLCSLIIAQALRPSVQVLELVRKINLQINYKSE
jgi:hypothetical protein